MKRVIINYVLDVLMLALFAILAVTGIVKQFFLEDPLAGRYHQVFFLGASKYEWSLWHDYSGLLLLAVIVLHILLHLKWLYRVTKSFLGIKGI